MRNYLRLDNPIMTYDWGSYHAIAELLGSPEPSRQPQAEMWMGAHPKAPSVAEIAGVRRPLDELIREFPLDILGSAVAAAHRQQLPFLFKVLAARRPLSIQAHPGVEQARAGFERENRRGLPLDAAERSFRDANHKPELICALDDFWALCGFRSRSEAADTLETICPRGLAAEIDHLRRRGQELGLREFFFGLLQLDPYRRASLIAETLTNAGSPAGDGDPNMPAYWIARIAADFPDDVCILAPAFMNLVHLRPEQALFLPSGCLHAYLAGLGIELMANSDNVLRAGLTSKHVDAAELSKALRIDNRRPEPIVPERLGPVERQYPCSAREFRLSVLSLQPGGVYRSPERRNVEILLCIRGQARIAPAQAPEDFIPVPKGASILVPSAAPAYQISGDGLVYRAGVP